MLEKVHEQEAKAQQEILGLMGVNLIYGAYYKHNKPRSLIKYLYDHIDPTTIEIDTINFSKHLLMRLLEYGNNIEDNINPLMKMDFFST